MLPTGHILILALSLHLSYSSPLPTHLSPTRHNIILILLSIGFYKCFSLSLVLPTPHNVLSQLEFLPCLNSTFFVSFTSLLIFITFEGSQFAQLLIPSHCFQTSSFVIFFVCLGALKRFVIVTITDFFSMRVYVLMHLSILIATSLFNHFLFWSSLLSLWIFLLTFMSPVTSLFTTDFCCLPDILFNF